MFYERFIALCNVRGVTPSSVAEAIGISNANATYWKKGSMPSSKNLQKLADYFEVPVDYLLGTNDAVTVDFSDKSREYETISKAEVESCRLFLTDLLREIDTLSERVRDEAIYEIASTAKLTLRRYKTLVPIESYIGL